MARGKSLKTSRRARRLPLALLAAFGVLSFGGCAAHRAAAAPAAQAASVHRVAVLPFENDPENAVSNEFIRQLLGSGLQIVDRSASGTADAILAGKVLDERPSDKMIIYLGKVSVPTKNGPGVEVDNPVVSEPLNPVAAQGSPMGIAGTQMVSVNALVGVAATLTMQKPASRILWADQYTYEGLDLAHTTRAVAGVLAQSLRAALERAAGGTH